MYLVTSPSQRPLGSVVADFNSFVGRLFGGSDPAGAPADPLTVHSAAPPPPAPGLFSSDTMKYAAIGAAGVLVLLIVFKRKK